MLKELKKRISDYILTSEFQFAMIEDFESPLNFISGFTIKIRKNKDENTNKFLCLCTNVSLLYADSLDELDKMISPLYELKLKYQLNEGYTVIEFDSNELEGAKFDECFSTLCKFIDS